MAENTGTNRKSFLTEGIMLAAVPIIAYYSAYQYEMGYYRAFGAPENLIQVDMSTFIAFGSAILGLIFTLYIFMETFWHWLHDKLLEMSWKKTLISLITIYLLLWLFFDLLYEYRWIKTALLSAGIVLLILLFRISKNGVYPKWLFLLVITASLLDLTCQGIGQSSARKQTKFTVLENGNYTFVIRRIGDYFLCSTYNPQTRSFIKTFQILPIQETGLNIEYNEIGPLRFSQ